MQWNIENICVHDTNNSLKTFKFYLALFLMSDYCVSADPLGPGGLIKTYYKLKLYSKVWHFNLASEWRKTQRYKEFLP